MQVKLSPMELRVLRLSVLTLPQMSRVLGGLSLGGLRFHVRNLMRKLEAQSRGEALVIALRLELVRLDEIMVSSDKAMPRPETLPEIVYVNGHIPGWVMRREARTSNASNQPDRDARG